MLYKMNASHLGCRSWVARVRWCLLLHGHPPAGRTDGRQPGTGEAAEIGMEHNLGLDLRSGRRRPGTGPLHRAQRHRRHEGGQLLPHGLRQ